MQPNPRRLVERRCRGGKAHASLGTTARGAGLNVGHKGRKEGIEVEARAGFTGQVFLKAVASLSEARVCLVSQ